MKRKNILVLLTFLTVSLLLYGFQSSSDPKVLFEKAKFTMETKGDLEKAIKQFDEILQKFPKEREIAAKSQLYIGICKEKLGLKEAIDAYQKVIENYPEFPNEVTVAKQNLKRLSNVLDKSLKKPKFRKIQIPTKIKWEARLSPDGQKIALVTDNKLWIMPITGNLGPDFPGPSVKLKTGNLEIDWCGLAWSGDGKWIAFNAAYQKEEQEGKQSMWIVSAEGGKPKKLHETYRDARVVNYRMSLSPQGKTLAFSSVEGKKQHIYTISTDGGVPKLLVDSLAREPVFSPDGKMIAYVEDDNCGRGGGGLWVVPAEGGTPKLVANAGMASSPLWSPGSDMLTFLDSENDDGHIYIIPLGQYGGTIREKITVDRPEEVEGTILLAGWTPDNKIGVIFRSLTEFGLYTLPAEGGKAAMVAHGGYPVQPRWSPDGKRIFHTNENDEKSGDWQKLAMAVVSAEGGKVTTVPIQSEEKIFKPAWGGGNMVSPDGKIVVFAAQTEKDTSQHWQIWTLPVEGGKPTQLTKTPESIIDKFPCWSPDGKSIAFLRTRLSKNYFKLYNGTRIYIVQVNGGEPEPLTSESDSVSFCPIAWSPDGKLIAYYNYKNSSDETINVIPVDGGEPRVVGKVESVHVNKELAWSQDSKRIAFNGPKYSDKVVRVISIEDGSIEDIETDLVNTNIYHLDWSPDGTKFVFGGWWGGDPEFWLMEDFLPLVKGTK